jgi:soluble lytic murein transglycosylase
VAIPATLFRRVAGPLVAALLLAYASSDSPARALARDPQESAAPQQPLTPTVHAPLPDSALDLWLVPSAGDRRARTTAQYQPLVLGVKRFQDADYQQALPLLTQPSLATTSLGDYAAYYAGLTQLRLSRAADARTVFKAIAAHRPQGYLWIAAALGEGEAAEVAGDPTGAVEAYQRVAADKNAVTEDVLSRLGRAALAAGDRKKAAEAFLRVYYEFPLTDAATAAGTQLASLQDQIVRTGYKLDLGRAAILFGARRYAEARSAYQDLQRLVGGDDRELVDLRLAECDFYLKRYDAARDGLRPYLERASRKAEARFFDLSAVRELGDAEQFIAMTRAFLQDYPDSSWSEEALNNLGTFFIVENRDDEAARTFRELYEKFPTGQRAERAAWKYGWWSYRTRQYAETVRVFEQAAGAFPRSDYRPSFLYWAARSHARLGEGSVAEARLRLVYADYANSYYGRLAGKQLSHRAGALPRPGDIVRASQRPAPPEPQRLANEEVIRLLLANGLYDDALNEARYAQRSWGTSPRLDATIAWIYYQKGELRRAITMMRRAYPQHLTSNGQELPPEILQVIFPLTFWNSIRRYSTDRGLDPYLIAALIAQESTFDPNIRSVANAWGLMQVVPSTGRRLARSLGIRRFSTASLTNPDLNIRLGTLYFSHLVRQFGGTYYALASYNAGESRVVRWRAERPGLDDDEFIDDIPFPETQNYVKRILGTAEDYRALYGRGGGEPIPIVGSTSPKSSSPLMKAPVKKKSSTLKKKSSTVKKKSTPSKKKVTPAKKRPRRRSK